MQIFIGFAPFIAFAVLTHYTSVALALWMAAGIAAALILRDQRKGARAPKILELGTVLLFAGLALSVQVFGLAWALFEVRLAVDCGLLAIAVVSLVVGLPFTTQYAREMVPPELWQNPLFKAVNVRITLVWAAAFLALTLGDAAVVFVPAVPQWAAIGLPLLAFLGAVRFTIWYPKHLRASPANSLAS